MTITSLEVSRRSSGRLWVWLGLAAAALGVVGYIVQIQMQRLTMPWYMPCLATLGVLFVVASLWQQRSVWRILALVLVLLVASATWAFLLAFRLPPYTGPAAVGQPLPAFTTTWANGTPLTQRDLQGDQNSVLVFFRGRW